VLAGRFGVSIVTLRNAVLCLEREGVVERRQGSGTYVCAPPPDSRHVALACGFDVFRPRPSHCFLGMFDGLRRFFEERGLSTNVYVGHVSLEQRGASDVCPELGVALREGRVAGAVGLSLADGDPHLLALREKSIPVVRHGGGTGPRVESDAQDLGRRGAEYLLGLGRRRLALVGWAHRAKSPGRPDALVAGFVGALAQAGLPAREAWIRTEIDPYACGAGWEEFREIWAAQDEKPDGLVVTDDMLLVDVAMAIQELRIVVPDRLAVITHANRGSLQHAPFPVARLELDPEAHACAAGEMLLACRAGRQPAQARLVIPHTLVPLPCADSGRPGVVPFSTIRSEEWS